jgi:hypothetical protein
VGSRRCTIPRRRVLSGPQRGSLSRLCCKLSTSQHDKVRISAITTDSTVDRGLDRVGQKHSGRRKKERESYGNDRAGLFYSLWMGLVD